jgi:hypothetical protein
VVDECESFGVPNIARGGRRLRLRRRAARRPTGAPHPTVHHSLHSGDRLTGQNAENQQAQVGVQGAIPPAHVRVEVSARPSSGSRKPFLDQATQADPMGFGPPAWVERSLGAYLSCGILAHGFARASGSGGSPKTTTISLARCNGSYGRSEAFS